MRVRLGAERGGGETEDDEEEGLSDCSITTRVDGEGPLGASL